ncbi:RNA-directed DNA polymerase [Accumulibacter sp.]|uniref:RNA-directed DNA polymerase n=1 Tax=Accumulibacter sp. TaxID=2053492 RepID=UPI001AD54BB2|nr:RNA-directed DNA polymerase [Accumulibacter sp.]MBN8454036.1 RNA-directed DNA polymerase [Accumulibacter sp.]MBO3708767.1 RNA-directed DNA polymerase [Candidatus Accumulibacter conexus]
MRTLKAGSYQRLANLPALWRGWLACRRGKRRTANVAAFEIDCDRHLLALQRELLEGRYRPAPWRLHGIRDPKTRLIAAPAVRDRVVHHAVLHEIGPVFERRFIEQSFAAGRGRGPQRAALYFLAGQRRHAWRLHLDISAYFPSIAHDRLLTLLAGRVRDEDTLALLHSLIASGEQVYRSRLAGQWLGERCPPPGRGLPLGSWFSQWCGNVFLDDLDHFIKRDLRIPVYLRYMDDLVLFADSKGQLLDARTVVGDWLCEQRGLSLNPKRLAVEPTWTPATFVGYRISRAGIAPGRKLRRNFRRRLRVAGERGEESLMRSIRSYRGLLVFP